MATTACEWDDEIELTVLRESIAAIDLGRQRCGRCGRSPLVGEQVFRYADGAAECEPCRSARRDAPPAAVEQVRNAGCRLTVQSAGPAPAGSPDSARPVHAHG